VQRYAGRVGTGYHEGMPEPPALRLRHIEWDCPRFGDDARDGQVHPFQPFHPERVGEPGFRDGVYRRMQRPPCSFGLPAGEADEDADGERSEGRA
jgi:hypothetical protein